MERRFTVSESSPTLSRLLSAALGLTLVLSLSLRAQLYTGPEVTVPDGQDSKGQPFQGPGAYPAGVTAANVDITLPGGSVLGGEGSNNLKVRFPAMGPIPWTESRHNEGDIAFNLGPLQPANPDFYPPDDFLEWAPVDGPTTYAWTVDRRAGIALASVRANGFDNQDTTDGSTPVGTQYGAAYFTHGFRSGFGYSPIDGRHASGNGSQDLVMGMIGPVDEANFPLSVAFFPYLQGWIGAQVSASRGANGEAIFESSSKGIGLEPSAVEWLDPNLAVARVKLGAGMTPAKGMLFVQPANSSSQTLIAGAVPEAGQESWIVANREDDGADWATAGRAEFSFLFVPWESEGLVGALISGTAGTTVQSRGLFSITRRQTGEYQLTLPGKTGDDGMLILCNAGADPSITTDPNPAFLSYIYEEASAAFVIQSRDASTAGSPLYDTDFCFAWIDFQNPLTVPSDKPPVGEFALTVGPNLGGFTVSLPTVAGVTYTLEFVEDLSESWQPLVGSATAGNGQVITITDTNVSASSRFYRVKAQ